MARVASSSFVGRTSQVAVLDRALEAAAGGETTTLLISGDPGVGKTRLLQHWTSTVAGREVRVATGTCLDLGEAGPAYTAVIEVFRALVGDPGSEQLLDVVADDRTIVGRILPELDDDRDPATVGPGSRTLTQALLFERLAGIVERAAADSPVVVTFEDVHWADRSTQAFLLYLVEMVRSAKLLLVATYRPEDVALDPRMRTTIHQLQRRDPVTTLALPPFDEGELREQLTGILGSPPTHAVFAAIHARSEGNALFAEELAAAPDPSTELPASLEAATTSKLGHLSPSARSVLRVASVVGRTAGYGILRQVTSLPDEELESALREAVQAGLLEPIHAGETYRFRHALLQEAIYAETLPGERRRLHGAVAGAISVDPDRPPEDAEIAPLLARHWYEAHRFDLAFITSRAAAVAASSQFAYAEATTHYERMLALWDVVDPDRRPDTRASILERAATTAFLAGDLDRSDAHGNEAIAELERQPDPSVLLRVLSQLEWTRSRLALDPSDVLGRLALLDLDGLTPAERVQIEIFRARSLTSEGDYGAAIEIMTPLMEDSRVVGDPALTCEVAMVYANLLHFHDIEAAMEVLESARSVAVRSGNPAIVGDVDYTIISVLFDGRRDDQVFDAAHRALEFAERSGLQRWARPPIRFALAASLLRLGRLAESLEQVGLARADAPTGRHRELVELISALVSTAMGRFSAAAFHLEASRTPGASIDSELGRGWLATARAGLALAEHRYVDARAIVDASAPHVLAAPAFNDMTETVWWLVEVGLAATAEEVEVAAATNDSEWVTELRRIAVRLTDYVEQARRKRAAGGIPDLGFLDGFEAAIDGHRARIDGHDRPELWERAAHRFPPSSIEALTARYRMAEALLSTRRPRDEAAAILRPAHAAAVAAGAQPLADRMAGLARRARIDLREVQASPQPSLGVELEAEADGVVALRRRGLSPREIEVLTLVAAGRSNGQIAERLFISVKTASVHVSHILDKLGVSTRVEAATLGVRLGLPDDGED